MALFVRLEAKPGRAQDAVNLLRGSLPMVERKPATTSWYGMRLCDSTFGIFDTFANENRRQAHPRVIEGIDVIAASCRRV